MARTGRPEFTFELAVCRLAERGWPPGTDDDDPVIVGRQLGTRNRRWDTVIVRCTPSALAQRAQFGPDRIDSDLRFLLDHAPTDWAWYQDALPDPGYPWRYVRAAVHRADARGIIQTRRDGNRIQIRQRYRYPDWVSEIIAVENKPDLDASAANALSDQLEFDIGMGLAEEVWVATRSTEDAVEPALLEEMPVEAGIAVVHPEPLGGEVVWHPRGLTPDEPGTRLRANGDPAGANTVAPAEKRDIRRGIAERAWERGWRQYHEHMRTDCRHFELTTTAAAHPPYCAAKECHQTPNECRGGCPEFEPEPPQWRTMDWPLNGGPGKAITRLLAAQRKRRRPEGMAGDDPG